MLRSILPNVNFRELFPVTQNLVYFNHAAVGPLSTRACEAMNRHAADQRDFGALHWRDWYAEIDRVRESAARLIGASPSEIAILKNTSEGLSFVAEGLQWNDGDNIVTSALEFPSNWTPWKRLDDRGVTVRVASEPTVEAIEPLLDDRTRVVSVSSVAFHNGFTADLDAVGELCARGNALFCVDAIQSVGVLPIDVHRSRIHFLSADGHKWMCGAEGAALFYVAEAQREQLRVLETGWTNIERHGKFINTGTTLVPDSRRFEAGSLNTNGVYGLRAAIDLLLEIGIDEVSSRAIAIANLLADGLESIGWNLAIPRPVQSAIIGATPPNVEKSIVWWHRKLEENKIVTAPREGLLRFSPHFYNDESDVGRVVETLASLRVLES
ncbi:MAG TPA: aminotransferase class V-fold PLP-dependent enzyme [Thermoanaerobaculia bacterium]|jgi:selenocysteine lyase/cysteine desulfurase|nr:aminotransferase class V-fold PLP-dependent enzyme [Thermoanaerobaculia bacterium]